MADATGALFDRLARVTITLPAGSSFNTTEPGQNVLILDTAGGVGLRITFKIVKTIGKQPNTAEITVYNLAPETRGKLQAKGVRLLLETGYKSTGYAQLFVGDVRTVDHVRDGANWKTVFRCGDGERAARFARASESFAGGATIGDVVRYCVAQLGLALGNSAEQASKLGTVLAHGWTVHGAAATELDRALRSVGYRYSIQDGTVQILAPGASVVQTIPDLSPDSGLVGSPQMGSADKKGKPPSLKFKALLMPQARPGGRVRLTSERYAGVILRAHKVLHEGDTHGDDWYTHFDAVQDPSARAA